MLKHGSPESESPVQRTPGGVKRKSSIDEAPAISRRAAKRNKKAAPVNSSGDINERLQINPAIAQMDGPLLADHVARLTRRFEKDISLVEVEDKRIPGVLQISMPFK